MKKYFFFLLALTALFSSCSLLEDPDENTELKGKHTYSGGTTKVKIGTWSTETVGNGKVEIDLDAGTFSLTAGSANTKTLLDIYFGKGFTNSGTAQYSFENMGTVATGDYWRETSSNIYWYSQDWNSGQYGILKITSLTKDEIIGEYEFKGTDLFEDLKERTVQGSFSIPKQ